MTEMMTRTAVMNFLEVRQYCECEACRFFKKELQKATYVLMNRRKELIAACDFCAAEPVCCDGEVVGRLANTSVENPNADANT